MSKHSEACCKIPPVIADGYEAKGSYTTLGGLKTYVTGPSDATQAIFFIYDIFGYFPQTLQGADILAYSDKEHPYLVFIPDFWEGNPADISWYPPNDATKDKLGEWFQGASPPKHLPKVMEVMSAIKASDKYNITDWGIIGYCWGGKMVSIISGKKTAFKAAVQTSPAMIDPSDAEKTLIPMCMFPTKDEDAELVEKYASKLTVPKKIETFSTQIHGFMSARADLSNPECKAEYERGYKMALEFFHEHL